jgi:hypothetical protein
METSMAARAKHLAILAVLATALAAVLVSTGSAGLRTAANPTIYFMYAMNCTFTIEDDSGKQVTSIAPGAYQVDVRTPIVFGMMPVTPGMSQSDWTACKGEPKFQLSGPGVDIFTTMTAGCESDKVFTATFQPSASYLAQDLNQPSVARGSFTTLASGSPIVPTVTYGGGKGKPQVGVDIVGSEAVLGTLNATAGADGKATLTSKGKTVTTLKSGRYKFTIVDKNRKGGFVVLGPTSKAPTNLSGVTFRGTKSLAIKLTPGRWTYYTSVGTIKFFRVTG